ncbi:MAG: bifunctional methylenetetrahydrofolate dehydrogenase/methenyltetrahydrofolate cyclohydrolase FolD [Candidatus Saccharimonadales bacterium]
MKSLNGQELAGFIEERQAHQVRNLKQAFGTQPKLAIVVTVDHPAINTYVRMKTKYGSDIDVVVETHKIRQNEVTVLIRKLNADESVHGIIVQLPLEDPSKTQEIVDMVHPTKDVDALGAKATFEPATPMAILWLLAGYNVDLHGGRQVLLVGRGRLVGAPLERIFKQSQVDFKVADSSTTNLTDLVHAADVIITATGTPGLVKSTMLKRGAIVVDAGVAGEEGKTMGDLADDVYERDDLTVTPSKGGVGPLTICALFDNVIRAARHKGELK